MKKVLYLLLAAITFIMTSVGCTTEETNPYIGTKWSHTSVGAASGTVYVTYFEITSATTFNYYMTINSEIVETAEGKYSYQENKLMIGKVKTISDIYERYLTGAEISGDVLKLYYYAKDLISDEWIEIAGDLDKM